MEMRLLIILLLALATAPVMAGEPQQSVQQKAEGQKISKNHNGSRSDLGATEPGMAVAGFPELSDRAVLGQSQVDILQEGNSNYVNAAQKGMGHTLHIEQQGNQNVITAKQSGNGEAARIQQAGDNNLVDVTQEGFANRAAISQLGQGNTSNVEQIGLHNSVVISQGGNGLMVSVRQHGNYNQAYVVQGN